MRSDEIYEAVFDDEIFDSLPARLAGHVGARSAMIMWKYTDNSAAVLAHSHYFDTKQLQTYAAVFAPHDPWIAAAVRARQNGCALNLESLVDPAEFETSFFYNEYVRQMGDDTFRCLGFRSEVSWGTGNIALQRGRTQASFGADETARLDQLAPHLHRALLVRGRLGEARRTVCTLTSLLDRMPHAALLVRSDRYIAFANAEAESMLERPGALVSMGGLLRATLDRCDTKLGRALAPVFKTGEPSGSYVAVHTIAGDPVMRSVTPFAEPGRARLALIMAIEPAGRDDELRRALRELYGLTPAEAAIACHLSQGRSLAEIASERRVTAGTLRSQVKVIAAKLGCQRQAEIVAMLHRLPVSSRRMTRPSGLK